MVQDAWNNVTAVMIKNCWDHADIWRDPIILQVPQTLTQRGWGVICTFADPTSGMTLPQAEDLLKQIFGDQYEDEQWQPALKIVTENKPDEDINSLITALWERSQPTKQPFIPIEHTKVAAEVAAAIEELKQRNQIFESVPSTDAYIEPEIEREVEKLPIQTEEELVAEVLREQAVERGDIVEVIEDKCEEDEPEMTTREILSSMMRLHRALLSRGDLCVRTAKMLALAQDEVTREEMQNVQQTTLDRWFGGGHAFQ